MPTTMNLRRAVRFSGLGQLNEASRQTGGLRPTTHSESAKFHLSGSARAAQRSSVGCAARTEEGGLGWNMPGVPCLDGGRLGMLLRCSRWHEAAG